MSELWALLREEGFVVFVDDSVFAILIFFGK